jgi:LysM repeat protein
MSGKHSCPRGGNHRITKKVATAAALGAGAALVAPVALADAASANETTLAQPKVVLDLKANSATVTPCADYVVKPGDTFSEVAARFDVPLDVLEPLNPGVKAHRSDYGLIFAGGHIHLPDGKCDPTSPSPQPPPFPPAPRHRRGGAWHHHQSWHHHNRPPVAVTPPPVFTPPPVVTPPPVNGLITPVIAPDGPGEPSGYVSHSPSFWIPLIQQAEKIVPLKGGLQTQSIVTRITIESSGNPNAINNYDINAQNGDPSRGLMQTIGATFNAYHVGGTSTNIYNPLANIAAALNYINHVYGGVVPLGSAY